MFTLRGRPLKVDLSGGVLVVHPLAKLLLSSMTPLLIGLISGRELDLRGISQSGQGGNEWNPNISVW